MRLSSLHSHLVFWGWWFRAMTRVSFAAVPATDQVAAPAHTIAAHCGARHEIDAMETWR